MKSLAGFVWSATARCMLMVFPASFLPTRSTTDGRLWVFGGWKNRSTDALNDVWDSSDGMSWSRQVDHAPWAPRSPISVVFHDKIWIYSGKHTGFDDNWGGDLWQMTTGTMPTG